MCFNERLQELRNEKGITQTTLAEHISIGRGAISRYETNRAFPDLDTLDCFCKYFNVTADYLLGFSDTRFPYGYNSKSMMTSDEKIALKYYKRLSHESQDIIKGKMVELYREENAKGKKQNREQTG